MNYQDFFSLVRDPIVNAPQTTMDNWEALKRRLNIGGTGQGLLSDLESAGRNAVSDAKWNLGRSYDQLQNYLDPTYSPPASTPESRAANEERLMNWGSSVMPGGMAGVMKYANKGTTVKGYPADHLGKIAVDDNNASVDVKNIDAPLMGELQRRGGGRKPKQDETGYLNLPAQSAWPSATRQSFDGVRPTVANPTNVSNPLIYDNPFQILQKLVDGERIAPESDAMSQIFGVTRSELADIARSRTGNMPEHTVFGQSTGGSAYTTNLITPNNYQRLTDILGEAGKHKGLADGMDGWYVMDPAYHMLEQRFGPDQAKVLYERFNTLTGWGSPNAEVENELLRGSAANWLANKGRFQEFADYGNLNAGKRPPHTDDWGLVVPGHKTHGAQWQGMERYLSGSGKLSDQVKVENYIRASGVPQIGFQTNMPVGDAHWARAVGLPDVRPLVAVTDGDKKKKAIAAGREYIPAITANKANASMKEMQILQPFFKQIAAEHGLEPVSGQARLWGAMSHLTGVTTPVANPKLGLFADMVMRKAQATRQDPKELAIRILSGEDHLNF